MPLTVSLSIKEFFFDRNVLDPHVQRAIAKGLPRMAAFVRRRARSLLRRRKATAAPGSPPSVHSTDSVATLKNILFGLVAPDTVRIGPVRLNQVNEHYDSGSLDMRPRSAATVPELHEFGGVASIFQWDLRGDGQWSRADRRFRRVFSRWKRQGILAQRTRRVAATYPARPFMRPSLDMEVAADKVSAKGVFANVFG